MAKGFREVTALSALITAVRLGVMFFLNKITAVILGPSGFAVIGHIQNMFSISQAVGGRSLNTGIIRFSSETSSSAVHIRASILISAAGALLTGAVLLFSGALTPAGCTVPLFLNWIVPLIPLSIFGTSAVTIILARFQGREEYRRWFFYTLTTLLVQTVISMTALQYAGLAGLASAMVLIPIVQMLITPLFTKEPIRDYFAPIPDRKALKTMGSYIFTGIVSVGLTPLIQVLIRGRVVSFCGIDEAGLWQSVLKLSELGLLLVTSTLSAWYLPRLAKSSSHGETGRTMLQVTGVVTAAGLFGILIGSLFGSSILALVFSESFTSASAYLPGQLSALLMQLISWALGSYLLIRGDVKEFIILETVGQLLTLALAWTLIPLFGVQGTVWGFFAEGVLYTLYLIIRFRTVLTAGFSVRGDAE